MKQVGSKFYPAKGGWYAGYDVLPIKPRGKIIVSTAHQKLIELVYTQAEDEGLWAIGETAMEAYLQSELRKLHAAVEFLNTE